MHRLRLLFVVLAVACAACTGGEDVATSPTATGQRAAEETASQAADLTPAATDTPAASPTDTDTDTHTETESETETESASASESLSPEVPEGPVSPQPGGRYELPDEGFAITFPDDWSVLEDQFGLSIAGADPNNASAGFANNVGVVVEQLPSADVTLEQYTQASLANLPELIPGAVVEAQEPATLAGREAARLRYTGQQQGLDLLFDALYTIVEDRAYVVTYTGQRDTVEQSRAAAEQVVATFELLP